MKRISHRGLAVMLALALSVAMLAAAIYLPATSQPLMLRLMQQYAPPEDTGLPAEEYPAVTEMITAYLKDDRESFQHVYTVDGVEFAAFNQKEQQHMADVQDLFEMCMVVLWVCQGVILLAAYVFRKGMPWRTVQGVLLTILVLVTVIAVQAVVDFDGMFEFFHRIAFDNELWMLEPRTDMLIRLMPIGFFVSYAAIIGILWLAGMAVLLIITAVCSRRTRTNERE